MAAGSHCLDIQPARNTDPDWLVRQREDEVRIIKRWLANYYSDLLEYKNEVQA